jgi:hypothetical protein
MKGKFKEVTLRPTNSNEELLAHWSERFVTTEQRNVLVERWDGSFESAEQRGVLLAGHRITELRRTSARGHLADDQTQKFSYTSWHIRQMIESI